MHSAQTKLVRVSLKLSREEKQLIARAAIMARLSLSEFIRQSILKKTNQVIQKHALIELGPEDWNSFVAMIEDPPMSSMHLKHAMKAYLDDTD